MEAVTQIPLDADTRAITFAKDQPEYTPLPALVYKDGKILIEWAFTEEERARIAKGETLRHWIWKPHFILCPHCQQLGPCLLQPTMLEVTDERIA